MMMVYFRICIFPAPKLLKIARRHTKKEEAGIPLNPEQKPFYFDDTPLISDHLATYYDFKIIALKLRVRTLK